MLTETGIHSSRMRTVRWGEGEGVSAWEWVDVCPRGVSAEEGWVSAQGRVCPGGCLPREGCLSWGMSAQVRCLPRRVSAQGGVSV